MRSICSLTGCGRHVVGQGLCKRHYIRMRRHGDPLGGQETHRGDPRAFFLAAASSQQDDCIEWPFSKSMGYGEMWVDGKKQKTHRAMLLLVKGEPPDPDMMAAHAPVICHSRSCINPRHLRWATSSENALDMGLDGTGRQGKPGERPRW
jgi:hypothetical protein